MFDFDIDEAKAEADAYLKGLTKLSEKIGAPIDAATILTNDPDFVVGFLTIGDYERRVMSDGIPRWNYRPRVLKGDAYDKSLYEDNVDVARIVSFTMPPLPIDSVKTGKEMPRPTREQLESGPTASLPIDSLAQAERDFNESYTDTGKMMTEGHEKAPNADQNEQGLNHEKKD